MINSQQLASDFGTHAHCLDYWINHLKITQAEIDFALANFNESQRRRITMEYLRPTPYLLEYPELINHVQRIGVEIIKKLPESVYEAHLKQLKEADCISDNINNRSFPYNSYNAEVFCTLRHSTKKSDITFIERMFGRSISHHSYPNAKRKLYTMAQSFAA